MGINAPLNRKLRMGLVGGGQGSFIGRVHSIAACLDNRAELVAGALSSDPDRAKASAPDYDIQPDRAYGSIKELVEKELALPQDKRIDFVSVATPNHTHFEVAKAAAEIQIVEKTKGVFVVTHNYTGYPLVRQAREMILAGELGEINAVRACYIQGWLRSRLEASGQKQAEWRTDPKRSGIAGCFGDIATHAYNLGRFITGLIPDTVSCHLKTFESGRALDDYGTAIIRYQNGALGSVTASQISHGRENDLRIEIDGTKGSLEWNQENPNQLIFRRNGEPLALYTRGGGPYLGSMAAGATRIPAGHPEGYLEAFANIYAAGFEAIASKAAGKPADGRNSLFPNVYDGVDGMNFITQCVASSKQNAAWLSLYHPACR